MKNKIKYKNKTELRNDLSKIKNVLSDWGLSYSNTPNKSDITIYPIIKPYNQKYKLLSLYIIPNNEYSEYKIKYNKNNNGYIDEYILPNS